MTVLDTRFAVLPGAIPPAIPPDERSVRFVGDVHSYWWLLIRGALLLLVTLGIYRFWLTTDIRRFLWSNTEVKRESLEYTGTASELFIGFLIAIAILIPLYVFFFIISLNLGVFGQVMSVIAFPVLAYLGHIAVYRARRYRLTRTVFRGVRFHQTGKAWLYAIYAVLWWTIIVLTIGLAYPFAQASLERYKMRNTFYGNLNGAFVASGFSLFWRGFPMWLLLMAPLAVAIVFPLMTVDWDAVRSVNYSGTSGEEIIKQMVSRFPELYAAVGMAIIGVTLFALLAIVLFPMFQAITLRWWASGLRFGEVTITCRLRIAQIYGAYMRFLGYTTLYSLAVAVVIAAVFFGFRAAIAAGPRSELAEFIVGAVSIMIYVVSMLGYSTIYQATAKLQIWIRGVESVALTNTAGLDLVTAEGSASSAVGEGLADALNVGSF